MLARLGNVIYWIGCIISALLVLGGAIEWYSEGQFRKDGIYITGGFLVAAFIVWLIGRACRYVLSAR